MASIILTAVGNAILPGIGGTVLGALGRVAGGLIDQQLGLTGSRRLIGPRLENLKVQDSRYGAGIPLIYGHARVAGQVIWSSDLIETTREENAGGGGKGGGGGVTTVRYSYSVNCAIAIGRGPIARLAAVWADGKQIFDGLNWKAGLLDHALFYQGTATQLPDSTLEAALGSGNVPAYRGIAYLVLTNLQLADFGNRLPNLTFEVIVNEVDANPALNENTDPNLLNTGDGYATAGGTPALIAAGSARQVQEIFIAGMENVLTAGSNARFVVSHYDVSGTQPRLLSRNLSPAFSINQSLLGMSWSRSPDGRMIALVALSSSFPMSQAHLVLFDSVTRQFGAITTISVRNFIRSIAWLDSLRCVIADHDGNQLGVQIFLRTGLTLSAVGFQGCWGIGSASNRFTISTAQFLTVSHGLMMIAGNSATSPTQLYSCALRWSAGQLIADLPQFLGGTIPAGGNNRADILGIGDGEFVFVFRSVDKVKLISFLPVAGTATVTRPWQILNLPVLSNDTGTAWFNGRIIALQRDVFGVGYVISEIVAGANNFSLVTSGLTVAGDVFGGLFYRPLMLDTSRLLIQGGDSFAMQFNELRILRRYGGGDRLQDIIGDILRQSGYESADYSVSAIGEERLQGYVLQPPLTGRGALEPLRLYRRFDLVESDDRLKLVVPHDSADIIVPDAELRATADANRQPPALSIKRQPETALPRMLTVDHIDPARDYEISSQQARRSVTRATARNKIALPVICPADEGKRVAEARLYASWAERDSAEIALSRRYLMLDPSDVVNVAGRQLRVTQLRQAGSVLQCNLVTQDAAVEASEAVAAMPDSPARGGLATIVSTLYCLDLPPLTASEDQAGFYAAMTGDAGWRGSALWRSADNVSYAPLQEFGMAVTAGSAVTVLPSVATTIWDMQSSVEVQLLRGTLASCSQVELLNGANAALLGGEIIQFQTATLLGDGYYRLSNLLRGRRGTESAVSTHAVGEDFILLESGKLRFLPMASGDRNRTYYYKALSLGQSLNEVSSQAFISNHRSLQPLAPVHLRGVRASGVGGDLAISWIRRARLNAEWSDFIDVPLDESAELYDLEIYDGVTLKRTLNNLTQANYLYTAAQQVEDFVTIPAAVTIRVYQRSPRFGRGGVTTALV
jgi:hypothetical protein